MRKVITNTVRGFVLVATFAVTIVSCEKTSDVEYNQQNGTAAVSNESNAIPEPLNCSTPIPDSLQPPAGHKFMLKTYATGTQMYQVLRSTTDPTQFVWVHLAPTAGLYLDPNYVNHAGYHFAGPTWLFTKGPNKNEKTVASVVKGAKIEATAIPWLLLKTDATKSSAGNRVTYIQRVCTVGGLAPSTPPTEELLYVVQQVPYTATYIFFEKE